MDLNACIHFFGLLIGYNSHFSKHTDPYSNKYLLSSKGRFSYFSFSCKRKQFLLDCVVNLGNFCKTFYVFLAPTNQVRKDPDSYSPLCPTTVLIRQRKVRICNKCFRSTSVSIEDAGQCGFGLSFDLYFNAKSDPD